MVVPRKLTEWPIIIGAVSIKKEKLVLARFYSLSGPGLKEVTQPLHPQLIHGVTLCTVCIESILFQANVVGYL
jgi:hypothetical protein